MRKPRKLPRKPVELEDLGPGVAKMHFHTDHELMALIRFYAGAIRESVDGVNALHSQQMMATDIIRYAQRLIDLTKELK